MNHTDKLSPNSLALIALCNEYCAAVENSAGSDARSFTDTMLRLLPRIYISVSDLSAENMEETMGLDSALDENHYDEVRNAIAALMGEEDTYLEVFEEDMKYSDTPISASISEGLADIFQPLYNFIEMVKDAPEPVVAVGLVALKEDFEGYWSRVLCNVLRAVNHVRYSSTSEE